MVNDPHSENIVSILWSLETRTAQSPKTAMAVSCALGSDSLRLDFAKQIQPTNSYPTSLNHAQPEVGG